MIFVASIFTPWGIVRLGVTLLFAFSNSPHKTLHGLPKFHFLCHFSFQVCHQKLLFHYSESLLDGCSASVNNLAFLIMIRSYIRQ